MTIRQVGFFGGSGPDSGLGIRNFLYRLDGGEFESVNPRVIVSCNVQGGVARVAREFAFPFFHFTKPYDATAWRRLIEDRNLDYLVLLGCGIRVVGVDDLADRIINEHPALLSVKDPKHPGKPLFGGKGMLGVHVHRKVIELGLKQSGSTTHFVRCKTGSDEDYDSGKLIIAEHRLELDPDETPESLRERVKTLQHEKTPLDIEAVVNGTIRLARDGSSRWKVIQDSS